MLKRMLSLFLILGVLLFLFPMTTMAAPTNTSFSTALLLSSNVGDEITITGVSQSNAVYYYINATAGQQIYVTLYGMQNGNDYDLAIYNASYVQVALSAKYSSSIEYITYNVPTSGRYYFKIKAADISGSSVSCKFKVILCKGVQGNSGTNSSYSRTAAASYMDAWYNGFNPLYNNYSGDGGDCTNYVSQVLHAGNMAKITGSASSISCWFGAKDQTNSETWKGAIKFTNHWGTNSMGSGNKRAYSCRYYIAQDVIANYATFRENIKVGDVIQFCRSGDTARTHSLVVRTKAANDLLLSAHTYSTNNRSLLEYLAADGSRVIVVIRVKQG